MQLSARLSAIALATLLGSASPMGAGEPTPSGEELEAMGARIGTIHIERLNVFNPYDPKESYLPYRLANRLHIVTREAIIRRELLFKEGDLYSQALVDESARNLRALKVIYHVRIQPVSYHDGIVDLLVSTQDTWTTRPSVRISRAGGETETGLSFSDLNFLGRVKLIRFSRRNGIDRTTNEVLYSDPRLWGSRYSLEAFYQSSDDGLSRGLSIDRPWYSLDTRWALAASGENLERDSRLFCDSDGETCSPVDNEISEFEQLTETIDFSYGFSSGFRNDRVRRIEFGYSYLRHLFSQDPDDLGFGIVPLPEDQRFSGPSFTFQRLKARYVKVTFYNQFDRIEDFNLGNDFNLSVQLSLASLGAERSELILNLSDSFGVPLGDSANLFYRVSLSGRTGAGQASNVIFSQNAESYWRMSPLQTLYVRMGFDVGINLDGQTQFLLGGDTGLRGYPARQFVGDRRLLLTLEHRVFTHWEILRLVRIGFAGFVEAGDAWFSSTGEELSDLHPDLGVGLRFAVTRSSISSVSRLDLAYAVDHAEHDVPRFQVLFGTALKF